jgi:hypothetical protein
LGIDRSLDPEQGRPAARALVLFRLNNWGERASFRLILRDRPNRGEAAGKKIGTLRAAGVRIAPTRAEIGSAILAPLNRQAIDGPERL